MVKKTMFPQISDVLDINKLFKTQTLISVFCYICIRYSRSALLWNYLFKQIYLYHFSNIQTQHKYHATKFMNRLKRTLKHNLFFLGGSTILRLSLCTSWNFLCTGKNSKTLYKIKYGICRCAFLSVAHKLDFLCWNYKIFVDTLLQTGTDMGPRPLGPRP
jgi:hypothetical protein